jgi:hypothetical protein
MGITDATIIEAMVGAMGIVVTMMVIEVVVTVETAAVIASKQT